MSTWNEVVEVLWQERQYQDERWGDLLEHGHEYAAWLTIMRGIMTKLELNYTTNQSSLDELRELTATAMACMEQHGAEPRK